MKKITQNSKASVSSSWVRSIYLREGAHGVVYLVIRNDYVNGDDDLPSKVHIYHLLSVFVMKNKFWKIFHLLMLYLTMVGPLGRGYNIILEYCSCWIIKDFLKFRGTKDSGVRCSAICFTHSQRYQLCKLKENHPLWYLFLLDY